ncbi:MAG: TetR/AcrR family transcriptional regulator [Myxococcota bacterium]
MRVPRQTRAQRTRDSLVFHARRLFAERGYANTTAAAVTEAAEVSKGSFYSYFLNKDELLREITREYLEDHHRRLLRLLRPVDPERDVEAQTRERVRDIVVLVADHHRSAPELHATITARRHANAEFDAFCLSYEEKHLGRLAQLLESLGFEGDPEATAFVLYTMVEGAMHTHILSHGAVEDERLFGALIDAVLKVIFRGRA